MRISYEKAHSSITKDEVDAYMKKLWDNLLSIKKMPYYVRADQALQDSGVTSPTRGLNTQRGVSG